MGLSGLTTFPTSSANPSVIKSNQFGTAMFTVTQTTLTGTGNYSGKGMTGVAVVQPTAGGTPTYGSSVGVRKAPTYVTEPRFRAPLVSLPAMEVNVRTAVERSGRLQANGNALRVVMDGPVVVLRGTVTDRDDRNLAEDVVRLIPGVQEVRNEIAVRAAE
jgi:hypothetical protein